MTHKYRVESGPFAEIVETRDDGRIIAAPPVWGKFIGSPINSLEWWLAACNQSCSKVRIPDAPVLADVVLPTYCACNELLENIEQLEAHVERGCWRIA